MLFRTIICLFPFKQTLAPQQRAYMADRGYTFLSGAQMEMLGPSESDKTIGRRKRSSRRRRSDVTIADADFERIAAKMEDEIETHVRRVKF